MASPRKVRLTSLTSVEKAALDQARKGTRNRILKDATGGKVFPAIARVKARADARMRQYAAALKAAKIRKRDNGKTVIFDTAGQRFRDFAAIPTNRKVYVMLIGKRGARRLINPDDPNTIMRRVKAQPLPMRPSDFRFDKLIRIAPKKYRDIVTSTQQKRGVISRDVLQTEIQRTAPVTIKGGDLAVLYAKIKEAYVKAVRSEGNLTTWGIDMIFVLAGVKTPLRVTTQGLPSYHYFKVTAEGRTGRAMAFRNGSNSSTALTRTITFAVNEVVRAELRVRGMVSQGSAARIAKINANKGVDRKEWRDSHGARWFGANLKPARIKSVQFRLYRIKTDL
jgi:hypothetical protein